MKTFLWLVRRELWEHRVLVFLPLALAVLVLAALTAGVLWHGPVHLTLGTGRTGLVTVLLAALALPFLGLALLLQSYYASDALYRERVDRSVLFWKSLPPGDGAAVLAKFAVAALLIPAFTFAAALLLETGAALLVTVALRPGPGPGVGWSVTGWLSAVALGSYLVLVLAVWYAPVWAALLAIGASVPRSPWLAGLLGPAALLLAERLTFGTDRLATLLHERLTGVVAVAFHDPGHLAVGDGGPIELLALATRPDPVGFLGHGSVWTGILVAALCLGVATRARRRAR